MEDAADKQCFTGNVERLPFSWEPLFVMRMRFMKTVPRTDPARTGLMRDSF